MLICDKGDRKGAWNLGSDLDRQRWREEIKRGDLEEHRLRSAEGGRKGGGHAAALRALPAARTALVKPPSW
jgi:hypothetical protein